MKVLVLCLQDWSMNAQFIDALTDAGFETALIAKEGFYINRNARIRRRFTVNEANTFMTDAILESILAWDPVMVLPTDEVALRQMQRAAGMADSGALLPRFAPAAETLKRSLSAPDFYDIAVQKDKTLAFARELGWKVPMEQPADNIASLEAFAVSVGYPVVLKHQVSFGGAGVKIVREPAALEQTYIELNQMDPSLPITAQQYIDGPLLNYTFGALDGEVFAEYTCSSAKTDRHPTGHALMYSDPVENASIVALGRAMVERMRYNGFGNLQFIHNEKDGGDYVIEMNPRKVPQTIFAPLVGIDFCGCLKKRLEEEPCDAVLREKHRRITFFPSELLSDPESPELFTQTHTLPRENVSVLLGIIEKEKLAEKPAVIHYFERLCDHAPDVVSYPTALARLYRLSGRYDEALAAADRALALVPEEPHAQLEKTEILSHLDDKTAYCDAAAVLLQLPLPTPWAHEQLHRHLLECGLKTDALTHLDQCIAALIDPPAFYYEKARLLQEAGKPEEALVSCAACLVRAPGHAEAWALYNQLNSHCFGSRPFGGDSHLHILSDDLRDLVRCCNFETPVTMQLGGEPYSLSLFAGTVLRFVSIERTVAETIEAAYAYCLEHRIGDTITIGKKTKHIPFEKQPFIKAFWGVINPLVAKKVVFPIR